MITSTFTRVPFLTADADTAKQATSERAALNDALFVAGAINLTHTPTQLQVEHSVADEAAVQAIVKGAKTGKYGETIQAAFGAEKVVTEETKANKKALRAAKA